MSDSAKTRCRHCTGKKTARQILCPTCWAGLPSPLRAAFNMARDHTARTIAVRMIYDHANGTPSML